MFEKRGVGEEGRRGGKVERGTTSTVLGKTKVMSFEDIEEARIKCAAKDATKGKGKRGRKRKSAALEADEPEAEAEEPELAYAAGKGHNGEEETWSEVEEWCTRGR
jgi:hypothetical protein